MKQIILTDHTLSEHLAAYNKDRGAYLDSVHSCYNNVNIAKSITLHNKTAVLLVLLLYFEKGFLKQIHSYLDVPEMERACRVLDVRRKIQKLSKKITSHSRPRFPDATYWIQQGNGGDGCYYVWTYS